MKIVHTEASCGWGGQEIRILEEARGMIARGHEACVLCPPEARIFAEAPRFGVPAHALPIGRKRLPGLLALRRWLKANPPDVINTHSSTDSWLAGLACASLPAPAPIVRTRHISAPIAVNAGARWLYGRSAQHVVTTGEALRQTLIRELDLMPDRVTSVPTGIDTQRFAPGDKRAVRQALGLDPDGCYLGIVATLRSWKGHLYLLEAFAQLNAPEWKLVIVGEGPMQDNIITRINELQLKDRVLLVGQRSDPENWMRALDLFCLPSYANEGVPQSVMQAMLTELPIVTTPVGAILEAVSDGDTALIVQPQNSDALAQALRRLIDDAALAGRLAAAARARATEHFSREHMLNRMQAIFRSTQP
ncbi:glycosyltransferase family 4 protein [uncultured Propionivibrio sp.]|uniref:glycosyltransferase family 4 protein n=1 Tax=uncultured Propionivibrio sp. TaxID=426737 RepID=UPI0029C07E57|nr:glycosyltransferase family 4 protein [uncultured Propionivibrio sp.]